MEDIANHQFHSRFADIRLSAALLSVLAAIIQLPAIFCGFELCDSGFYMTFYDNVFTHPEAVGYNFMYYLSGVVGGVVNALCGGSLLAMRVFGGLCNIVSVLLAYGIVRRSCMSCGMSCLDAFLPCMQSVLMIGVVSWSAPLAFYNDTLTILLAMVSLRLLYGALMRGGAAQTSRKTFLLLFLSGLAAGVNAFSRLPNVLEIFFVLLIPLVPIRRGVCGGKSRACLLWLSGWVAGVGSVLVFAATVGHIGILVTTVRDLFVTALSSSESSSHGLSNLVSVQLRVWSTVCRTAVPLVLFYFLHLRFRSRIIDVSVFVGTLWLVARVEMMTALGALSLAGIMAGLFFRKSDRLLLLSAFAMFFLLPLGSDNGFYNFGATIFWLALPVSLSVFGRELRLLSFVVTAYIVCVGLRSLIVGGTYFDDTPLSSMTGRVDSPVADGIRTSPDRAGRVNSMLAALRQHVDRGNTLLVYGSAPMINHLTGTVPAIGCSWPELLTPDLLSSKLAVVESPPRHVLMLRFRTLGAEWGSGSDTFLAGDSAANVFHNSVKSRIMLDYIESNGYSEVVCDSDFMLYSIPYVKPDASRGKSRCVETTTGK